MYFIYKFVYGVILRNHCEMFNTSCYDSRVNIGVKIVGLIRG